MGKNHRHKKNLKSEKAKTKFKNATKFLPKGLNVTNTEFKIKPIVLSSQLTNAKTTCDGERTLDLKEVLSRLKHYNEKMQVKACEDMEYIIKNSKEKLGIYIPEVVQNIASYIQQRMPKARKAGLSLINTYLQSFPEEQISPYFHYFSVNLRCAMTHIDRNIQEDSIGFFDSFLTRVPALMAKHSNEIFPDFLNLVSKLRNDNQLKRTLTLNLNSKFSAIGWRIQVFGRLFAFIEAISQQLAPKISDEEKTLRVTYNTETYERRGIWKTSHALFNPVSVTDDFSWFTEENDNYIQEKYTMILTLLYESWLEGAPVKPVSKEVTYLTEEAGALLNCVIKVLYSLWSYLDKCQDKSFEDNTREKIPRSIEGEKLIVHLVQNLPYGLVNRPKQQGMQIRFLSMFMLNDVKCVQENLLICYLYLLWFSNNPSKAKPNHMNKVVMYLSGSLLRDYQASRINLSYLILILKHLLVEKPKTWSKNNVEINTILENTIILYKHGNIDQDAKIELIKLLASVTYEPLMQNKEYDLWLQDLPELLIEPIVDERIIHLFYDICRKNKTVFVEKLLNISSVVIGNLDNLRIPQSKKEVYLKLKIIDMLFYVPMHNADMLKVLRSTLDENSSFLPRLDHIINMRKDFNRD